MRCRLKRCPFKLPLYSVILSNVRYLKNKLDLLHAKSLMDALFKELCVIALTETWFESVLDTEASLDDYRFIKADSTKNMGKVQVGGVCIYINSCWCTKIKVHQKVCKLDMELLTLSTRAFYLLGKFPTVLSCTYVPPSINEQIAHHTHATLHKCTELPVFLLCVFNSCHFDHILPAFN